MYLGYKKQNEFRGIKPPTGKINKYIIKEYYRCYKYINICDDLPAKFIEIRLDLDMIETIKLNYDKIKIIDDYYNIYMLRKDFEYTMDIIQDDEFCILEMYITLNDTELEEFKKLAEKINLTNYEVI